MATVDLTAETFVRTVEDNDVVLVDFWAEWCPPCRMFAPVYQQVSENHPDVVFGKVDTEDQPELAASFAIRSIPTLAIFREQVLLFAQPGALQAAALEELLTRVRSLDMDEVRRELSAQQAAS